MTIAKKEKQLRDLDSNRIAQAALSVADELGFEGFSMRAVAKALDVTPMALYHHVKDKAGLVALVVDATMRAVELPLTTGDWREDLWVMAKWSRQISINHPTVSRLRREYQIWTPSMLQKTERWLSLWQQSGLPLEKAVLAAKSSGKAIAGLAEEEIVMRDMPLPDEDTLAMLPNVRVMYSGDNNVEAEFELAVKSLIDGVYQNLSSD